MLFYVEVRRFKESFSEATSLGHVRTIANEFLVVGSLYEVNLDDVVRTELLERIER